MSSPPDGDPPPRSLDGIGFYTISEARARRVAAAVRAGETAPIHRAELVINAECNLRCTFCNSLEGERLGPEAAARLVGPWSEGGARYVHITGGEPTLHRGLEAIIAACRDAGAVACMTTNGLAPWARYEALVGLGLRDVRVSLHAADAERYGRITGAPKGFARVVETIRRLTALRERAVPDLYVMVNLTVNEQNVRQLPSIIATMQALDPDDIKPVAITQWSGARLAALQAEYAREILPALSAQVRPDRHPILRYRLASLLTRRLRGFAGAGAPGRVPASPRCWLMLDDRCADATHYYPCNIYLRERGAPLGDHREDAAARARARARRFVYEHDVREDPICAGCCPDVVREYNAFVEALVQGEEPTLDAPLVC